MYPLSDKDLDRLSKEAAEQYDVEQNTSGWEQLEQKLNKYLPSTKKDKRRFLFFLFLIALLSGGGLLWILTGEKEKIPYVQTDKAQPNTANKNSNTSVAETSDKKSNKSENKLLPEISTKEKTQPSGITSETENVPVAGAENVRSVVAKNNTSEWVDRKEKTFTKTKLNKPLAKQQTISNNPLPSGIAKNRENNIIEEKQKTAVETVTIPEPQENKPDQEAKTDVADKEVKDNKIEEIAVVNNNPSSKQKQQKSKKYPLEIGLIAGPDFSNVKFSHSDKVGLNYGVQIGYRISKRLSVNTGLLYTKKNYKARGEDYHPPKGYWTYNPNIRFELVDGTCSMLDIPLNIRYDFASNKKNNYFVSSGLSSYIMKNEDYTYYYLYNANSTSRDVSYKTDRKYWLSVMNFSLGYERSLNKNFSLQAEPYLKIPLKGVGFGNMQLNSYGVYLSVKYKPGFNSSSSANK